MPINPKLAEMIMRNQLKGKRIHKTNYRFSHLCFSKLFPHENRSTRVGHGRQRYCFGFSNPASYHNI